MFLEVVGGLAVIQGIGAVVSNVWGRGGGWFVINHLAFLDGYEIFVGILLAVLGVAVCLAAAAASRKGSR